MTENQTTTRFDGDKLVVGTGEQEVEFDAAFLVAVLLFSIASSDGEISPIEIEKMMQLVAGQFELETSQSIEVMTSAVQALSDDPDLTDILQELASNLTPSQKEDVGVMMYEVVAADGREDAKEVDALTATAEKIGISKELLETARERFSAAD